MKMPLVNPKLTLRWLAAHARGKGVEVGVIDSGVDGRHPALKGRVSRGCALMKNRAGKVVVREIRKAQDQRDNYGHGTAVAGIITRLAPAAKIVNVRVLDAYNACTGDVLLAGLEWALDQKIRLLNMSLATLMPVYVAKLHELCERAYVQNTIIVASKRNFGEIGYPARFSSVLSVDRAVYKDLLRIHYRPKQVVEFDARGTAIEVLAPGGETAIQTGTSFATPHVCGMVALLLEVYPDLTAAEAKAALMAFSQRKRWPVL